jgi:hypothetical protein
MSSQCDPPSEVRPSHFRVPDMLVILSEDCSLREKRKEQPQSKDPCHFYADSAKFHV